MEIWQPHHIPYFIEEGETPRLRSYLLPSDRASAVIVLPGGGYGHRADHEGEPVAKWLNTLGISAFVLDYRVAPYKYPVPLMDVQRAVRLIRHQADEWGIDRDRMGLLGFSAGGHLAALAGTAAESDMELGQSLDFKDPINQESSKINALILCYPVLSFLEPFAHQGSVRNLVGEAPSNETIEKLSIENRVTEQTPPIFMWHTADDAAVPVENCFLLATALRNKGQAFDLHIYQNGRHGLGLAKENQYVKAWTAECESWLRKQGFIETKHPTD